MIRIGMMASVLVLSMLWASTIEQTSWGPSGNAILRGRSRISDVALKTIDAQGFRWYEYQGVSIVGDMSIEAFNDLMAIADANAQPGEIVESMRVLGGIVDIRACRFCTGRDDGWYGTLYTYMLRSGQWTKCAAVANDGGGVWKLGVN